MGKRIMFIVLLLTTLVGCNTMRHIERDTTERIDFSQSDIVSVIKMANYNQSILDSILAIRKITFRIYDIEKPPNEDGIYPLLLDGEINDTTSNVHKSTETRVETTQYSDSVNTHVEDDKTSYTRKETEIRTDIANMTCIAVAIVSIIFAIFVLRKTRK